MKKLAKYLVLFLVVAALAGVFAFSVFAEDETTPWTPSGEYENIAYGVWTSEAEYLAGNAPTVEWFPNEGTVNLVYNANGGYYRIFTDTVNVAAQFRNKAACVIDLGGHTIGASNARQYAFYCEKDLTVKNGTWYTSQQIQGYATFTFENLNLYQSNGNFCYGFYGNLKVVNSTITFTGAGGANGAFFIDTYGLSKHGVTADNLIKKSIEFYNSDFIISSDIGDSTLFSILDRGSSNYHGVWNVFFDSQSSLIGNVKSLMGIRGVNEAEGGKMLPEGYSSNLFFERGATVSANIVDTFAKYSYQSDVVEKTNYDANAEGAFINYYLVENTNGAAGFLNYTRTDLQDATLTDLENGSTLLGEPAAAWEPADATVTYAHWASKADYILGKSPDDYSNSLSIKKYGSGFIKLYGSNRTFTTASSALHLAKNESLELDLGGNTINKTIFTDVAEGATLIVKNGAFIEAGQTYYRGNSTFIAENIDYSISANSNAIPIQILGAKLVRFENCTVTVDSTRSINLNYPTEAAVSSIEFIATRVNAGDDRTVQLFNITENRWGKTNKYTVRFDKDSSVYGSVPVYAKVCEELNGGVITSFKVPQNIYFELGFTCSAAAMPDFTYVFVEYDDETKEAIPDQVITSSSSDVVCRILVVAPGTTEVVSTYYFNQNKYGNLTLADEEIVLEKWAPAEDTKFAVWATYEDYLAEFYPIEEYNGNMTAADLVGGYVRLYSNTSCADNILLESGNRVIDLAGFELTLTKGLYVKNTVGTPALTLKNGTINHNGGQVQFTQDTFATYDNITLNVNYHGNIFYGSSTTNLTFNNSIININNPGNNFHFAGTTRGHRLAFNVINTVINVNVDMESPLIHIIEQDYGYNAMWDITFDGVTLQGEGKLYCFLYLVEGFAYSGGNATLESFNFTQNVALNNVTVGENQYTGFNLYTLLPIDLEACDAASDAAGKKVTVYLPEVTRLANDSIVKVTIDGVAVTENLAVAPKGDAYSLVPNPKWTVSVNGGLPFGYTTDTITMTELKAFEIGTVVTLCENVTIGTDDTSFQWADGLTFELNGKTAYINLNWLNSDSNIRPDLTWKNGTIEVAETIGGGTFQGYFGTLTFDNVIFNYPADDAEGINIYGGNVRFIGGEFNATGAYSIPIRLDEKGAHNLYIDGTTIRATRYAIMKKCEGDTYSAFTIKNATFILSPDSELTGTQAGGYAIAVYSAGNAGADNYLDIAFENCTFTATAVLTNEAYKENGVKRGEVTVMPMNVTLVNCALVGDTSPVSPSENINIEILDKKTSIGSSLQANLTLYTNFEINFYADPSVISEIYLAGARLEGVVKGDKVMYTISVPANEAAEALELVLIVTVGGETYAYSAEYSVLKYAEQLIASEYSEASKKLISSAIAYVQAAYEYSGKTAPEFAGVAFDNVAAEAEKPTMPEAIKSAQLDLASGFKLRFNITAGYTGTVVVDGVTYDVVDGAYNGITYFEVDMRAYALYDTAVEITADGVTGSYALVNYVVFANGVGGNLADLANALYTYTAYANAYKASNPGLD